MLSFETKLWPIAMASMLAAPAAGASLECESLQKDAAWATEQINLRTECERWVRGAMARQKPIPFQGGHDELNYTASWARLWQLTGDATTIAFLRELRDQLMAWPGLYHGFYPDARWDIEHSVENWTVFVTELARVDPKDERTVQCLEDVAHHLGNWEPGVPAWFDWEAKRFRSEYVGTKAVRDTPPYDYSTYWDARASELALTVYQLTGNRRYLDFASAFANGWADEVLRGPDLGYWMLMPKRDREEFKRLYGEYPENFQTRNVNWRPEMMQHLLHVYTFTKEERLAQAALKIIQHSPSPPLGWLEAYERATGDTRFADRRRTLEEDLVKRAVASLEQPLPTILMLEGLGPYPTRKYAIRTETGELRDFTGPGSGELLKAAHLSGDARLLTRAFALAARELHLAALTLRDGREHGCNGRWLHGAGGPAVGVLCGSAGSGSITYRHDGKHGLLSGVAAVRAQEGKPCVCLHNATDRTLGVRTAKEESGPVVETRSDPADCPITLAPKQTVCVPLP